MQVYSQKDYKNSLTDKLLIKFNLTNKQKFVNVKFFLEVLAKNPSLHILSVFIVLCLVKGVPKFKTPSKSKFSKKISITTGFTDYLVVFSTWLFLVLPFFEKSLIKKYSYNSHSQQEHLIVSSVFFRLLVRFFQFTIFFEDSLPITCSLIVNQKPIYKKELYNSFLLSFYKLY